MGIDSMLGRALLSVIGVVSLSALGAFPQVSTVPLPEGVTSAGMSTVFHRPLVSDSGKVAFVAPAVDSNYFDGLFNSYLWDSQTVKPIFPEAMAHMPGANYTWALVGDGDLNALGGIQFTSINFKLLGISLGWTDQPGVRGQWLPVKTSSIHPDVTLDTLAVSYAPAGKLFMLNGGSYRCVLARLSEHGETMELGTSFGERLQPSGFPTALSADGRYLFFSSEKAPEGNPPGMFPGQKWLSIYRYDLRDDTLVFVGQSGSISMDPEVSCSADGRAVVYRCNITEITGGVERQIVYNSLDEHGRVSQAAVISRWRGAAAESPDESGPCESPFVSANGQFVAFSARTVNFPGGGSGRLSQVYRYEVSTGALMHVSASLQGAHAAPSLSPDGRFVAFVNQQDEGLDSKSRILLADCGPSLRLTSSSGGRGGFEVGLETSATADGRFRLSLAEGQVSRGHFVGADGTPLVLGQWYAVSQLPVRYESTELESFELTVEVAEGDVLLSDEVRVEVTLPWSLEPVSVNKEGKLFAGGMSTYGNLALSEQGDVVLFSMDDDLLGDMGVWNRHVQHLFVRRQVNGAWQTERLTGPGKTYSQPVGKACLSGDGKVTVFVHGGKLIRLELDGKGTEIATVTGTVSQLVADVTGKTVVWLEGGALKRWTRESTVQLADGGEEFALSRDGRTVVWVSGDSLWSWTVEMEAMELRSGLPGLHVSGLSLSGHRVYYTAGESLYGQDFGGDSVELGGFEGGAMVRVSGNGCVALFTKVVDGVGRLYHRRLGTSSAADVLVSSPNGVASGNGWSDSEWAPACMSGDGQVVVFASQASNLVEGDTNRSQDLFRWTDLEFKHDASTMAIAAKGMEDQILKLSILPVSEQGSNVVLSLAESLPAGAREARLLAPSRAQGAYELQLKPSQDFCGVCSVRLTVFDGREASETTATLTFENVNDAPYWKPDATMGYVCDEGQALVIELTGLADDVDQRNQPPYHGEALSFGADAPEHVELELEEGRLTVKADYDAVNRLTDGTMLEIPLTVTDKAGDRAEASLQLTVRNRNRAPKAYVREIAMTEGETLALGPSSFSDPDAGDALCYVFTVREGTLRDGKGQMIVSGETVSAERLPVVYAASEGHFNRATFAVKAVDESGAQSDEVKVTVTLKRQAQAVADLWGGSVDGSGTAAWSGLAEGWNLLAVPMELKGKDFQVFVDWLNPVAIWRWNGQTRRYEQGTELNAHEGFWVYLDQLPEAMELQLKGNLGAPRCVRPGWQLTVPAEQPELEFAFEPKAGVLIQGRSGKPGQGVWRYGKEAGKR